MRDVCMDSKQTTIIDFRKKVKTQLTSELLISLLNLDKLDSCVISAYKIKKVRQEF